MRKRLRASFVIAVVFVALVASPAAAHHDDGKGDVIPPSVEALAEEFENVVAANANEDSNAPRGFAPCINGMAAETFPCDQVDMLSHLTLGDLGLSFANDIWGWTDPQTKKDYALIGGIEGTVIVDISDPRRPDIVGTLPTHSTAGGDFWRDIKVYQDHAFVVSENSGHGMQVLDLTEVRGVTGDPVEFAETAIYGGFGNAHNLNINEDTGYAYAIGTSTCDGGLHMVDISDPVNPAFAGCFEDHGYIHDTQCVIYEGADVEHVGKEICFSSAADGFNPAFNTVSIVDVTDKANPVSLSRIEYDFDGYSHQGWLSPDQSYFFHNDELDEVNHGLNTTTRIFDVNDLDDPFLVEAVEHGTTSIGHNAYTEGRFLFASNYTSGLRVFNTTSAGEGELAEVAYFDLYPENDNPSFEGGTWSNYPYFHQKKVVAVSSMDRGLFVLRPRIGS
jgi:choice-of-anchor B domain-containing protein